ncbi:Kunitz/Bovine pancreatic trypsin inhibitor domain protein [Ancylostoma duodenale]|uniref:Kunitz/Bovine pancreatic trypsin inhibitor domain protein n=1 Tax=Ancylostoma duodenale TaxID=51022 RepID=A0A0C2H4E7_9BILA|nr:Kunitz/Bovine pancreatic trypsin inhibitor domain protein [Ancylostoma duodenale]
MTSPTPPPESTTEVSSTTRFLRPERKQTNKTKFINPCPSGRPLVNEFNTPISCNYLNQPNAGCPEEYWCHTGATFATTSCCLRTDNLNRCEMRRDTGEGSELVARWYYDKQAKQCRRFLYKGIRGNANNFVTKTQCVDACDTSVVVDRTNPCRIGNPASHRNNSRIVCGPNDSSTCPRNYYCHLGETPETTACCESSGLTDLCLLALNVGQGKALLKRFYYNTFSKRCTEFVYRGAKGNENNFLTLQQCQDVCQKWSNPCPSENFSPRKECSANGTECGINQWCHVGGSQATTVCCSGASPDPCSLPVETGDGSAELPRWYADPNDRSCSMQCKPFVYKGTKGNQNNFLTRAACERQCKHGDPCAQELAAGEGTYSLTRHFFDKETRRCREFNYLGSKGNANNFLTMEDCELVCPGKLIPNPCRQGEPLLNALKEPIICGGEDSCINGYWCHVGGSPETTNCCPGTRRPCDLPLETGQGSETLERWFYDGGIQASSLFLEWIKFLFQMCRTFVYKGMKGNSNNFLTKQACRQACKELNPCGSGEPLLGTDDERVLCSGGQKINSCPRGFYCHVGSSALTTLCCPRNIILEIDACDQPVDQGTGGDDLPRWFFDRKQNRCAPFNYGGIGGNENNFISESTCSEACPVYRNYCPHGIPLVDNGQVKACGIDRGCPDGFICHMSTEFNVSICCQDPVDFCSAPRDPGPCTNYETRYGYNAATDTCVEYQYGGCDGTLNNFHSLQRCTEICCKEYKRKL